MYEISQQSVASKSQRLKIGVSSGCVGKTSIFTVIMIDDVALWSELSLLVV